MSLQQRARASDRKGGHHRNNGGARLFCLGLSLLGLLSCSTLAASELETIDAIAKAGAPTLAVELLDVELPAADVDPAAWMSWQRERIRILSRSKDWQRLEQGLATLPAGLPDDFLVEATTARVRALIALERPREARSLLLERIWGEQTSEESLAVWRHLLIKAYVAENRIDDAYRAMLRFRQDYGIGGREERILRARILLIRERPAEAEEELASLEDPQARALRLLARLRNGASARQIQQDAKRSAQAATLPDEVKQILWGVAAEAAARREDFAGQAIALEQIFGHYRETLSAKGLFGFSADDLWDAYLGYAQTVGNREKLLIGQDQTWFDVAAAAEKMYPVRARSMYALLAAHGTTAGARSEAHRRLMAMLSGDEDGRQLLRALYLESEQYQTPESIPEAVRYQLADQAIAEAELELASKLLRGLEQPPGDIDSFMWQLRRAKVFVLAGDYGQAGDVLSRLVQRVSTDDGENVDRVMQVLFDLQTAGEHDRAYELFNGIFRVTEDLRLRRELLYWMADSRQAQERYRDAAKLYLLSAIWGDPKAMDPWAQTARYQAAQALAKGGLVNDAAGLYRQLLKVTEEPARRAVLLRDLEQLRLK